MFRTAVILLITLFTILHSTNAGCRVNLRADLMYDNAPVFLQPSGDSYELLQPGGDSFEWKNRDKVIVGCSSINNKLSHSHFGQKSIADLFCDKDVRFSVRRTNSEALEVSDIRCNLPISGAIKSQQQSCPDSSGTLYDVGFALESKKFVKYFTTCYNEATVSAIYSEHQLPGMLLTYGQSGNRRPGFKVDSLKPKASLAAAYTQKNQLERFSALLESLQLARHYINSTSFLAKGHLTPDADAILNTWANATYFYINAAPQWQVVNAGNWVRVENAVRQVAKQLNANVQVYTGVHDVLQLPNESGALVPITLADGALIEVPKWFWKVVVHEPTLRGIAFITLNNPFATREENLCVDICDQYGWQQAHFQHYQKGFTYCCTVEEARRAIREIPKKIKVKQTLIRT